MEKKLCFYCKSELEEWVIKCKHCWEFVDEKYKMPTTITYRWFFQLKPKIFCPNCKYEWRPTYTQKWSSLIQLILLLFFIIPWIIYGIWRWRLYYICPKCKNKYINIK